MLAFGCHDLILNPWLHGLFSWESKWVLIRKDVFVINLSLVSGFCDFITWVDGTVGRDSRLVMVRALWLILVLGFDLVLWYREYWYLGIICGPFGSFGDARMSLWQDLRWSWVRVFWLVVMVETQVGLLARFGLVNQPGGLVYIDVLLLWFMLLF